MFWLRLPVKNQAFSCWRRDLKLDIIQYNLYFFDFSICQDFITRIEMNGIQTEPPAAFKKISDSHLQEINQIDSYADIWGWKPKSF